MASPLRSRSFKNWADLFLISIGLVFSRLAYRLLFPGNYALFTGGELLAGFLISLITFWAALKLCEPTGPHDTWPLLFEQFCVATGLSLVLHALLNYFDLLTRSFFLIVMGALFAALLLGIARRWVYSRDPSSATGVVLIGFDPLAGRVARALGLPVLGVVGSAAGALPPGVSFLGEISDFEKIVDAVHPSHVLLAVQTPTPSPSVLLGLRRRGIVVSDVPTLYEQLFERVYCRGLEPADMLLSPSLCADSRTLAIQAVYTNLVGLLFLIVLSPVIALVSLSILLFSRPGPAIESIECSGFQKIPFRLLRFRTLRGDGSGELSGLGKLIERLHLANLPRLINIVRGEVALFGPRPVRREFAHRLSQIMPFYSIRFFVKPGILGCAPAPAAARTVWELREIEYDLYYIKQASPRLDLEILLRAITGMGRQELPVSEPGGAA